MTDNHSPSESEAEKFNSNPPAAEPSSTPENPENTSPATTSETPTEPDRPREPMTPDQVKALISEATAESRTQLTLDPELRKAILDLATKPAVTDSMLRELEKRFLPKVLEALMPKVEHRLFSLLVSVDILPRQALDDLERKQRQEANPDFDLGDRALGAMQQRPRPAQPTPTGYHPDPHRPHEQETLHYEERQPSSAHPERPMNQSGFNMGPLS